MENFEDIIKQSSLIEFQAALEDPQVKATSELAKQLAKKLNESKAIDPSRPVEDDNTRQLDSLVRHVMGTPTETTGIIWTTDSEGEPCKIVADNAMAVFQGYVADYTDQGIEYKYALTVALPDEVANGCIAKTVDEYEFDKLKGVQTRFEDCVASIDDVGIVFDKLHPSRALAWLSMEHPELLSDLDERLIGPKSTNFEGSLVAELQIMCLKGFAYYASPDDAMQTEEKIQACLKEYAKGLIALDYQVPYDIVLTGGLLNVRTATPLRLEQCEVNALSAAFLVKDLAVIQRTQLDTNGAEKLVMYSYYLRGNLYSGDIDQNPRDIFVPVESIEAMASLRNLYPVFGSTGQEA